MTQPSSWTDAQFHALGLLPPRIRVAVPGAPQDVASCIDASVASKPDATALVARHRRVTFREFDAEINAAVAALVELGVESGDRIAATAANDIDICTAFFATQRLGAIWIGINRALGPGEKIYLLKDSGVKVYLADTTAAEQVRSRLSETEVRHVLSMDPGDENSMWRKAVRAKAGAPRLNRQIDPFAPAALAYTSGTTGFPKGAVHSQHNIMVTATICEIVARDHRPDVVRATPSALTILNMMMLGPVASVSQGMVHICMDRIDWAGVVEWVWQEKINTFSIVPTVLQDILTRPEVDQNKLKSLTWVNAGGAMCPEGLPALYKKRFGHSMSIGYGLTESPAVVTRTHEGSPDVQGAVGLPMPHIDIRILDDGGNEVPADELGEICIRAKTEGEWANVYTPTLGYWKKPEATAKLLAGGWLHTGDVGSRDKNGEIYIRDRRSDLIVRGGANVYPAEVERILRMHKSVVDCAVIGRPDQRLGETVAVALQLQGDIPQNDVIEQLKAICAKEIAAYKTPIEWHVVDALPRNTAGKVVKGKLKSDLLGVPMKAGLN